MRRSTHGIGHLNSEATLSWLNGFGPHWPQYAGSAKVQLQHANMAVAQMSVRKEHGLAGGPITPAAAV